MEKKEESEQTDGKEKDCYYIIGLLVRGLRKKKRLIGGLGIGILLVSSLALFFSVVFLAEDKAIFTVPVIGEIVKFGLGIGLLLFLFSLVGEGKEKKEDEDEKTVCIQGIIDMINKELEAFKITNKLYLNGKTNDYYKIFSTGRDIKTMSVKDNGDRLNFWLSDLEKLPPTGREKIWKLKEGYVYNKDGLVTKKPKSEERGDIYIDHLLVTNFKDRENYTLNQNVFDILVANIKQSFTK